MLLAGHVGARLHVCHVSTAGSVEILRWAKAARRRRSPPRSPRTTCCSPTSCAESYDPVFKVNPPLRTDADVEALRAGLADGTIDAVATDHAPHAVEDKESEWAQARPGHARAGAGAVGRRRDDGRDRAARLGRASPTGCRCGPPRSAGWPATAARSPPASRPTCCCSTRRPAAVVDPAALASRSRNSPYAGRELPGRVVATFLRGDGRRVARRRKGDRER